MSPGFFLEVFISVSLQAVAVVLLTIGLSRWTRSSREVCGLWTISYVLLLALTLVAASFPHIRSLHPWHSLSPDTAERLAVVETSIGWLVMYAWLAGMAVSAARLALAWNRGHRFVRTCQPAADLEQELECELKAADGSSNPPVTARLLTSPHEVSPFCWQLHCPHIVLPASMRQFSREELGYVVRHELAHLKAGHPLQLFLQRIVEVIFWFHPVVWLAAREAAAAREFACDDAATANRTAIAGYLKMLLSCAERQKFALDHDGSLGFGRGPSLVTLRSRRLIARATAAEAEADDRGGRLTVQAGLACLVIAVSLLWVPVDVLASAQARWSPWPSWSAQVLHLFSVPVRDFEPYGRRSRIHELHELRDRPRPAPSGS
jgi:beta-lactamase regulating signal transducer with metallopeptidase domain